MRTEDASDEAKRRFARDTDEINRFSQRNGPGPGSADALAEILAEHEKECAAVMQDPARNRDGTTKWHPCRAI